MSSHVEVMQVIRTDLLTRGTGTGDRKPFRRIVQFWSFDGKLLAENDSWRMQALQRAVEIDSEWTHERLYQAFEEFREILNS